MSNSSSKKKSVHKKPWFWLLLILIASAAVRMTSKNPPKIPLLESDEDDVSSAFEFKPQSDNFTVKEEAPDDTVTQQDGSADSNGENLPDNQENSGGEQKLMTVNDEGKSVFHFILNTATKKYHLKECSAVKKLAEDKRMDTDIEADSLKQAKNIIEDQGYALCGLCDR